MSFFSIRILNSFQLNRKITAPYSECEPKTEVTPVTEHKWRKQKNLEKSKRVYWACERERERENWIKKIESMLSRFERKNVRINSNSLTSALNALAFVATAIATNIIYENGNIYVAVVVFFSLYYSNVEYDETHTHTQRKKQQAHNRYTRSSKKNWRKRRKKKRMVAPNNDQNQRLSTYVVFFLLQHYLWFFYFKVMRHAENEQEYFFELNTKKEPSFLYKMLNCLYGTIYSRISIYLICQSYF